MSSPLVALTIAIPDIKSVTDSGAPIATIMREQLGAVMEKTLLVCFLIAFFAVGMVTLATGARLVFAMSRDGRFPAHKLFRKVDPRTQTPVPATILPVLIYSGAVVLYLGVRKKLDTKEGAFSLGRFELPVAVGALVWLAIAFCVLVLPASSHTSDAIVGGLILVGAIFFAGLYIFNREALETEPGDANKFD